MWISKRIGLSWFAADRGVDFAALMAVRTTTNLLGTATPGKLALPWDCLAKS
jgi:hypothetical protein